MNKKIIYLAIALLAINARLSAQGKIGLEAGMSFSSLSLAVGDDDSPKVGLGLKAGINYLYKINNTLDFESGIFFYQKGQRNENKFSGISSDYLHLEEYSLNYINLPVKISSKFNKLFISYGLYVSYCFDAYYTEQHKTFDALSGQLIDESSSHLDLFTNTFSYYTSYYMASLNNKKTGKRFLSDPLISPHISTLYYV